MVDMQPPRRLDLDLPGAARIYDAFLGGSHNFDVERRFVDRVETALPGVTEVYRESRAFVRRSVEYLIDRGIRQFLDLGSGIPTIGPVHEIARRRTATFRVVYVDNEPLTVAQGRPLLGGEPRAAMVEADCRDPRSILDTPEATALLDLNRPLALMMSSVLHFLPGDPRALVACYRDVMAPGSHLMLSHVTADADPSTMRRLEQFYGETADPLRSRETEWIEALFDGLTVVEPGITYLSDWRPDPGPRPRSPYRLMYGGLGVKYSAGHGRTNNINTPPQTAETPADSHAPESPICSASTPNSSGPKLPPR
jgi:SAM-dependent methyltransferase